MKLELSRKAVDQAEQFFAELTSTALDSERFRDRFVACLGMIGRVGSVIDEETKGHRTATFGNWWKATAQEPLLKFVTDVRNAEFKRGEDRKHAQHNLHVQETVTINASAQLTVIRDGHVVEERSASDPAPSSATTQESMHTVT